jgi:hypothetical protein
VSALVRNKSSFGASRLNRRTKYSFCALWNLTYTGCRESNCTIKFTIGEVFVCRLYICRSADRFFDVSSSTAPNGLGWFYWGVFTDALNSFSSPIQTRLAPTKTVRIIRPHLQSNKATRCPLLVQSGHVSRAQPCPFSEVKRKSPKPNYQPCKLSTYLNARERTKSVTRGAHRATRRGR